MEVVLDPEVMVMDKVVVVPVGIAQLIIVKHQAAGDLQKQLLH